MPERFFSLLWFAPEWDRSLWQLESIGPWIRRRVGRGRLGPRIITYVSKAMSDRPDHGRVPVNVQ